MAALDKVTAFILRPAPGGRELLLFQHPFAGIQFPAGTVEPGEAPAAAAAREAAEESGLAGLELVERVAVVEETPVIGDHFIAARTTVYSRPDPGSFDWATLRRGVTVQAHRHQAGYAHVTFEEPDRWPEPQYATYRITGWVPQETLCRTARRHLYRFTAAAAGARRWTVQVDQHLFAPFWAPLDALPEIIAPQRPWLDLLRGHLGETR